MFTSRTVIIIFLKNLISTGALKIEDPLLFDANGKGLCSPSSENVKLCTVSPNDAVTLRFKLSVDTYYSHMKFSLKMGDKMIQNDAQICYNLLNGGIGIIATYRPHFCYVRGSEKPYQVEVTFRVPAVVGQDLVFQAGSTKGYLKVIAKDKTKSSPKIVSIQPTVDRPPKPTKTLSTDDFSNNNLGASQSYNPASDDESTNLWESQNYNPASDDGSTNLWDLKLYVPSWFYNPLTRTQKPSSGPSQPDSDFQFPSADSNNVPSVSRNRFHSSQEFSTTPPVSLTQPYSLHKTSSNAKKSSREYNDPFSTSYPYPYDTVLGPNQPSMENNYQIPTSYHSNVNPVGSHNSATKYDPFSNNYQYDIDSTPSESPKHATEYQLNPWFIFKPSGENPWQWLFPQTG